MDNLAPLIAVLMSRMQTCRVVVTKEELDAAKDKLLTIRGDGKALHLVTHEGGPAHMHEEPMRVQ